MIELSQITKIIEDIIADIQKNKLNSTEKSYEKFLQMVGMGKRTNAKQLEKINEQFKERNITFWSGGLKIEKITSFKKGEIVKFKLAELSEQKAVIAKNDTRDIIQNNTTVAQEKNISVDFAGKINIENAKSEIVWYEHQEKAFQSLDQKIIKSNKKSFAGLLVLPTGGGKTLTAGYWIAKNYLDKGKKVLWIAHRHELLEQAKNTFADKLAFNDVFKNKKSFNYRIISGIHDRPVNIRPTDDLIISSKDSLNQGFEYLYNNWIKGNEEEICLVIDEAHHATAKTYRKLIQNIQKNVSHFKILGLTATPFRTEENEQGLLKKVFPDDIVYKVDLKTLIRLGILSEPCFEEVQTRLNFVKKLSDKQIQDIKYFDIGSIGVDIAKTIAQNDERNLMIVNKYISNKEKYKQTIIFALNVDNAIALNALFKREGIKSDYVISTVKNEVTGATISNKENKLKIAKFKKEEIQVLINVNILTEGVDVPNVQSIFLARPTISSILMTQMIGRGLRGLKAGGTKQAYIVSFIDDWQNRISWVNPEKLFIEENTDFHEADTETKKNILRLVNISKIEEFAILTNEIIDPEKREQLENLSFIERFPVGIYQFRFLEQYKQHNAEKSISIETNCEILVYDNILQSYTDFINALPSFFEQNNLTQKDVLDENELEYLAKKIEANFFKGTLRYPAYNLQDIKNILQYYTIQDEAPVFIALKDREKYDIDKIASEIIEKDLGEKSQALLIDEIWNNNEAEWQTFFNFNQRAFLQEINLAKLKINFPKLFLTKNIKPNEEKELRNYEKLTLQELREHDSTYEKTLRDQVFKNFTDKNGFYYSAESGYKSKNKLDFNIDHITPISKGGLTVLENLQLLKTSENAKKGNKT